MITRCATKEKSIDFADRLDMRVTGGEWSLTQEGLQRGRELTFRHADFRISMSGLGYMTRHTSPGF